MTGEITSVCVKKKKFDTEFIGGIPQKTYFETACDIKIDNKDILKIIIPTVESKGIEKLVGSIKVKTKLYITHRIGDTMFFRRE